MVRANWFFPPTLLCRDRNASGFVNQLSEIQNISICNNFSN